MNETRHHHQFLCFGRSCPLLWLFPGVLVLGNELESYRNSNPRSALPAQLGSRLAGADRLSIQEKPSRSGSSCLIIVFPKNHRTERLVAASSDDCNRTRRSETSGKSLNERVAHCADDDVRGAPDRLPRSRILIVKERPGPISRSPGLVALLVTISHQANFMDIDRSRNRASLN